jgi:hypothetical protein
MSPTNDAIATAVGQLRGLPASMRQELRQASEQGSPVLAASVMLENVALLVKHLPCLREAEAGALLAPTEARARVRSKALVEKLSPYIDENYYALRPVFWQLDGAVGGFGKRVLDQTLREVQKRRRARGAAEIALLDALLQVHENELAQAARDGAVPVGTNQVDAKAADGYEEAVSAFLDAAGADPRERVLGGFTAQEVGWLREIKDELRLTQPNLLDPRQCPADAYYRQVVAMFERARELNYGPRTARLRWEIQEERRRHPNTLYSPLDGRGPAKWGGLYPSVRRQVTVERQVPEQGPRRVLENRVLTGLGHRLMAEFEAHIQAKHGPTGFFHAAMEQQMARERENRYNQLLSAEQEPGKESEWTWRWDYTLEQLGFGVEEIEVTIEVADKPWEGVLGQTSVAELLEQMAEFHRRKGVVPPDEQGGHFHQIP